MPPLRTPTALDRFIQQAVQQVLGGRWERTFSEHSYGFRPGRSAHQAVAQAQAHIAVRSRRAGDRVLPSITRFLTGKLKLKVNESKSGVARPAERKFLGFSFTRGKQPKRRIAPKTLLRFKKRIRELTKRNRGVSLQRMVEQLRRYLIGWRGYFGFCQTPSVLRNLDSWIRRRLRCFQWKLWKRGKTRFAELRKRGVGKDLAAQTAGSSRGLWHISRSPALSFALPGAYFDSLGLPRLEETKHV